MIPFTSHCHWFPNRNVKFCNSIAPMKQLMHRLEKSELKYQVFLKKQTDNRPMHTSLCMGDKVTIFF